MSDIPSPDDIARDMEHEPLPSEEIPMPSNAMTVGELIRDLQKVDPDAIVGAGFTEINGWVNSFSGIKSTRSDAGPVIVLDMYEETISPEELDIQ